MNSQTSKVREYLDEKFVGLTDLEWAKIEAANAEYEVAHEAYRDARNEGQVQNRSLMKLAFAERVVKVEEVLAGGNGFRVADLNSVYDRHKEELNHRAELLIELVKMAVPDRRKSTGIILKIVSLKDVADGVLELSRSLEVTA